MPREAVIEIATFGDGRLSARLWKASVEYPDAQEFEPLDLDPSTLPKLDTADNVNRYAECIGQALNSHGAIRSELEQIALTSAPNSATLRFLVSVAAAERLRWETLGAAPVARFLALNGACSLSRVAHSGDVRDPGVRNFSLPVKMAAFLSAAKEKAGNEFKEICVRVAAARAAGLDVVCTAYLGEQDLLDAASADVAAGLLPGITVAPMPPTAPDIERVLRVEPVQILHAFCHGLADTGELLLEFATINDWDIEAEAGSVRLSVARLRQVLLATGSAWVTVLNSCSGAKSIDDLHSMASALAKAASPVTVGMAEPIQAEDATLFAQAFYEGLFDILRTGLDGLTAGQTVVLDLAPAVRPARDALYGRYLVAPADAFGRWSLPLLYEREAPLEVMLAVDPSVRARVELVAGALRSLHPTTPTEVRLSLLAVLDADPPVPVSLRPDIHGRLI